MSEHTAEKAQPKTLDPNDLGMYLLRSGVRAASVGEDGDVMFMGHHDDDTAWALYVEFQTYEQGSCDLTLEDSKVYDIERRYAAFSDHSEGCELVDCACDEDACEACRAGKHDECADDLCECSSGYDHDFDGPWPCSCECYCDEYAWWVSATKSGHEVTWVRWSWAKNRALAMASANSTPPGQAASS